MRAGGFFGRADYGGRHGAGMGWLSGGPRGYIYRSSAVQVTLRGERREHERRATAKDKAS